MPLAKGVEMTTLERQKLDFSVFLMHRLAESWGRPVPDVYLVLNRTGALRDYIYPGYDVLHTLGSDYLVEDLTGYVRDRGVQV